MNYGMKKGFLQIDFAFVVLIFFSIFYLVFGLYESKLYEKEDLSDIIRIDSDSKDLCNFLISSSGSPANWHKNVSSMNYPGFKSISNNSLLNESLSAFNSTNYFSIIDTLSLSDFMKISVVGLNTSNRYLDFGVYGGDGSLSSSSVCFSNYNGEIVSVEVSLWY